MVSKNTIFEFKKTNFDKNLCSEPNAEVNQAAMVLRYLAEIRKLLPGASPRQSCQQAPVVQASTLPGSPSPRNGDFFLTFDYFVFLSFLVKILTGHIKIKFILDQGSACKRCNYKNYEILRITCNYT